jgi:lipoprotein-releasing system permease protein
MTLPFECFIALRYLRAKRKQAFISVITLISVIGVAIGVMALFLVLGVMTGFTDDLRDKILGTNSHIVISRFGAGFDDYTEIAARVSGVADVAAATPFMLSQVMLSSEANVSGVRLWGIDPATVASVITIEKTLTAGRLDDLQARHLLDDSRLPGIVIGSELAHILGIYRGSPVTVLSPVGLMSPAGMMPRWKRFLVVGIFESGMYEYDTTNAYISIADMQEFLKMPDEVTGIALKVHDIYRTEPAVEAIRGLVPPSFEVRDWKEMHSNLYSALKLEKTAMFIILTLIIIVAAFSIVATLVMMVNDKNREIAILKSMGAPPGSIMRIFMAQGLVIGISGTALGLCAGAVLAFLQNNYQIVRLAGDVYYIAALTVKTGFWDTFWVAFAAVLISFLATLYPSRQAAVLDPVEAMRYE